MKPIEAMSPDWIKFYNNQKSKGNLNNIFKLNPNTFYPNKQNVFNVFSMPVKDIKVVIIGQDPYIREGQAIGYAFAIGERVTKPFSFRTIEKEVGHDLDKSLKTWRDQGNGCNSTYSKK